MPLTVEHVAAALVAAMFAKRGAGYCADGSHKGCRYITFQLVFIDTALFVSV
jgi:hypothetical protein